MDGGDGGREKSACPFAAEFRSSNLPEEEQIGRRGEKKKGRN